MLFLIELEGLNGRAKLEGYDVESVVKYPGWILNLSSRDCLFINR